MNNKILKIIATFALLVQVLIPMWWGAVIASFYYFWIEGIIEGGALNIFGGREGNIFWGLFSVFCVIAFAVSIRASFLTKLDGLKFKCKNRDIIFLLINILTIILAIIFVVWNGGFIPKL